MDTGFTENHRSTETVLKPLVAPLHRSALEQWARFSWFFSFLLFFFWGGDSAFLLLIFIFIFAFFILLFFHFTFFILLFSFVLLFGFFLSFSVHGSACAVKNYICLSECRMQVEMLYAIKNGVCKCWMTMQGFFLFFFFPFSFRQTMPAWLLGLFKIVAFSVHECLAPSNCWCV